nr:hypothetical protein [Tanacetum cinerariifolium]
MNKFVPLRPKSFEEIPKPNYVRPSTREKTLQALKASPGQRLKTITKVAKYGKKKLPAIVPNAKGLETLSEVALSEDEQMKIATKRSKTQSYSSHTSSSGDGVDTQLKVPDKQQQKVTGTYVGAGDRPERVYTPQTISSLMKKKIKRAMTSYNQTSSEKKLKPRIRNFSIRSDIQKNLYNALVESYNSDKVIITFYGDVVTLKRGRDNQDKDEDPSAGSIEDQREGDQAKELNWHNPEGKPYPHDLSKPLPLIQNKRSRQVIPWDYFINNNLEYLKGGSSSQKYTTSITKTKAANYGQTHRHSRTCRRSTIGSRKLPEEDQPTRPDTYRLDLKRINPYTTYPDFQGIIYEDEMNKNHLTRTYELHKFSDGTLNHVRTTLNNIATGIEMDYLPKQK